MIDNDPGFGLKEAVMAIICGISSVLIDPNKPKLWCPYLIRLTLSIIFAGIVIYYFVPVIIFSVEKKLECSVDQRLVNFLTFCCGFLAEPILLLTKQSGPGIIKKVLGKGRLSDDK